VPASTSGRPTGFAAQCARRSWRQDGGLDVLWALAAGGRARSRPSRPAAAHADGVIAHIILFTRALAVRLWVATLTAVNGDPPDERSQECAAGAQGLSLMVERIVRQVQGKMAVRAPDHRF
jgi:hypothetical protein